MERFVQADPFTLLIKGSRFLAEMLPCRTPEEARAVLAMQRQKYGDATHVVHAFVTGNTGGILGCSDDGEPSGTAGRPVLEVLRNSGLTEVILTVVRWFGGTKLGTGGLVHAYSDSAKGVLATAVGVPLRTMHHFDFTLPFSVAESAKRFFGELEFTVENAQYGSEGLAISGTLPAERTPELLQRLCDLTRGALRLSPPKEEN